MPTDKERIAALKAKRAKIDEELADLGGADAPLTPAQIRKLTPDEAKARWAEVVRSLPADDDDDGHADDDEDDTAKASPVVGVKRIARGYGDARRKADWTAPIGGPAKRRGGGDDE